MLISLKQKFSKFFGVPSILIILIVLSLFHCDLRAENTINHVIPNGHLGDALIMELVVVQMLEESMRNGVLQTIPDARLQVWTGLRGLRFSRDTSVRFVESNKTFNQSTGDDHNIEPALTNYILYNFFSPERGTLSDSHTIFINNTLFKKPEIFDLFLSIVRNKLMSQPNGTKIPEVKTVNYPYPRGPGNQYEAAVSQLRSTYEILFDTPVSDQQLASLIESWRQQAANQFVIPNEEYEVDRFLKKNFQDSEKPLVIVNFNSGKVLTNITEAGVPLLQGLLSRFPDANFVIPHLSGLVLSTNPTENTQLIQLFRNQIDFILTQNNVKELATSDLQSGLLAALTKRASSIITPDCGFAHLAGALLPKRTSRLITIFNEHGVPFGSMSYFHNASWQVPGTNAMSIYLDLDSINDRQIRGSQQRTASIASTVTEILDNVGSHLRTFNSDHPGLGQSNSACQSLRQELD